MTQKCTLSKNERLKSRKLLEQCFSEGKKIHVPTLKILYLENVNTASTLQFGVGVSSKNFKKAVDRNRVKRLIKEVYRLQKSVLQSVLIQNSNTLTLFFIYTGKEIPLYADLFTNMGLAIKKLSAINIIKKE